MYKPTHFIEITPEMKERIRQISPTKIQVILTLDEDLINKLEKIKNLYSHKNSNPNYSELIGILADEVLQKDKRNTAAPPGGFATNKKSNYEVKEVKTLNLKQKVPSKASRYIPSTVKQEVYMRDKGCCTYTDQKTKRKCDSRHLLQYDHIKPISMNGENTVKNLRLLCFQHHKLITEQTFGKRL